MSDYDTNLNDSQWEYIKHFVNTERKRKYCLRSVINAILYLEKTGCQWRMLPKDFPKWNAVYRYFEIWVRNKLWTRLKKYLHKRFRQEQCRPNCPSLAIVDSQSVKTTFIGGDSRGIDGNKKIKGRKRHLLVDVFGIVLAVLITPANMSDDAAFLHLLVKIRNQYPRLELILGDLGYENGVLERVSERDFGIELRITKRFEQKFIVEPKRWIVERTIAWLNQDRRLIQDYERRIDNSEAMIMIATARKLLNKIDFKPIS
jgi:putative transposase